jgi:hypothetical protein
LELDFGFGSKVASGQTTEVEVSSGLKTLTLTKKEHLRAVDLGG